MAGRRFATLVIGGFGLALATPLRAQQVAEVQVSPPTVSLTAGGDGGVFATAYDANGNVLVGLRFQWSSSNPNIVRVEVDPASSDVARLIGVTAGVARVEARVGSRSGTAAVQVVAPGAGPARGVTPPTGAGRASVLRIEPSNVLMLPSESRQLIAIFLADDGSTASPTQVSWNSLNPAIATVAGDGSVVAIAEGQGTIEAVSAGGLRALAPVRVQGAEFGFATPVLSLSPGSEATVQVIVPSQGNRTLPNGALSWRSTNDAVVRATPLGVARAVGPGSAEIVVGGFLQERTLRVTVHRPVTELTVLPRQGAVAAPLGGTLQFTVRALAGDGTPVPEAPLNWSVADTTIATFDAERQQLAGRAIGETELRLIGPGPGVLEARWQVSVIAGGLLAAPQRVGIGIRDTVRLTAAFTDKEGVAIGPATGLAWSTLDPQFASVTGSGTVTGLSFGRARIVAATPWEAADTVDVFVQGDVLITASRSGSPDLFSLDRANPASLKQVTNHPAVDVSGAFSPDGSQVAFASNRDGNFELYVANADGSEPRRLTQTENASEDQPVWTPDGAQLVYVSQAAGERGQIWIMQVDGTNARPLTTGTATNFEPTISPDGQTIAFTSTRDGNYEIYTMGLDGGGARNVTNTAGKESHPGWFPDGQLGYIVEQSSGAGIAATVVRRDLGSGASGPVSPSGLVVTDFAVAPAGDVLALEVSELAAAGISRRIIFVQVGTAGTRVEVPRRDATEQHSGPAFRPARR